MSTGSATHQSLIQGISQQAPNARGSASCEHQENCLNDVLEGVVSRMGSRVLGSYFDVYQDPFVHGFKRSSDEQYLVIIEGTSLRVLNRVTGELCTITGNMTSYLPHTGVARKAFQAITVGDTTFILNRQKAVGMGLTKSSKRQNSSVAYFQAGGYKITYTLTLRVGGVEYTTSYETPDNSSPSNAKFIGTDYLAQQFLTSLVTDVFPSMATDGHTGFTAHRNGSTIIIYGPLDKEYTIHTSDGVGDTHLIGFRDSLDSISKLPKRCIEGYIVSISTPGAVEAARYWLRYVGDSDNGKWEEVVAPDTVLALDAATMPHLLVCTAPNTFEIRQATWGERVSGDGDRTSPDPSFVGYPIRSLQFISGRLAAVTEYTMALSRARNAYVFFPDTAQTTLDTAPIDYDITNGSSTDVDTSLSDVDRYPLRLSNLIVMSLDRRTGPDLVSWGTGDHLALKDVQTISLDGDRVYGPASVSEGYSKYQAIRAVIDPSGGGKDETTLTIGAVLHSTVFVLKQAGWLDGHGDATLKEIAQLLVEYNVQTVRVEEDFGLGMFGQLLRPYLKDAWEKKSQQLPRPDGENRKGTEIVSEKAKKQQKEHRIIAALETAFNNHRIVMSKELLQDDYRVTQGRDGTDLRDRYSLMYQITRLTREKDCLTHDDRVEGLAELVTMFQEELGLMPANQAEKAEEERREEALRKLGHDINRMAGIESGKRRLRGGLRPGGARR